jgi:hypothetical protein
MNQSWNHCATRQNWLAGGRYWVRTSGIFRVRDLWHAWQRSGSRKHAPWASPDDRRLPHRLTSSLYGRAGQEFGSKSASPGSSESCPQGPARRSAEPGQHELSEWPRPTAARTYPTRRDESSAGAEPHLDDNVGVASRRGADRRGWPTPLPHRPAAAAASKAPGNGFLPVPRGGPCHDRRSRGRPPGSFATRCATDPTTASRRRKCRSGLNRSWLLATGCRR